MPRDREPPAHGGSFRYCQRFPTPASPPRGPRRSCFPSVISESTSWPAHAAAMAPDGFGRVRAAELGRSRAVGNLRGRLERGSRLTAARQAHREYRTLARFARHGHVPAHHARELAGDGKAEPRTAVAPRRQGIALGEILKQFRLLLRS